MATIKNDEHVFIVGMSGSGKSYFAESYLACYDHVIKLDTKGEYFERKKKGMAAWRGLTEGVDFVMVEHLADLPYCETDKIIYCPSFDEQNEDFYNEFFRFCYERENTIIWVDELMEIATAYRYPEYLKGCLTRGRSKNVAVWNCAQRCAEIPQIVAANSTHFIMYRLPLASDRKRMAEITGCMEMQDNPAQKYTFWYFKNGMENALWGKLVETKGG